jgi:hypothetical protein
LAALIAVVMPSHAEPNGRASFINPPSDREAKIRISGSAKGVVVPTSAVNKENLLSLFVLPQFGLRQISIEDRMDETILAWPQGHYAATAQIGDIEIKCQSLLKRQEYDSACTPEVIGRALAGVQYYRPEFHFESARASLAKTLAYSSNDIGTQSRFTGFARFTNLTENSNDEQKIGDEDSPRQSNYRIIEELIDNPRKALVVSYAIGALNGAVGVALYLKGRSLIGALLIGLGIFTPLIPWWLYIAAWWASP